MEPNAQFRLALSLLFLHREQLYEDTKHIAHDSQKDHVKTLKKGELRQ